MTRGFLFGSSTSTQSQSKYLVEFKAGKMTQKGKMVHPDKRQGMVYVHQSDDSLMHFCWKDRTSGAVEDDLIIFPDDAEFKRVPECTTGRVYVLKFKSSSRRCFYWMQEPKAEKDEELVRKVNESLNNPPLPGASRSGTAGSTSSVSNLQAELSNIGDEDLQNLLNNMSQHQLVQLLGGIGGVSGNLSSLLGGGRASSQGSSTSISTTGAVADAPSSTSPRTTAVAAPTTVSTTTTVSPTASATASATSDSATAPVVTEAAGSPAIQLSDLQSILSGIKVPSSEQMGGDAEKEQAVNVDLSVALNSEAVLQPLLSNRELMSRVEALLPRPAQDESSDRPTDVREQLRETLRSSQFQQALSMFSSALQSGQLGPLMQQFGMDAKVVEAANSGDMDAFVKALQTSKSASSTKPPVNDDDQDDDMGLD